jgi:hypothetical protein
MPDGKGTGMARAKRATEALIVKTGRGYRPQLATRGGGVIVTDSGTVREERESTPINIAALGGDESQPLFGKPEKRVTVREYEEGAVRANIGRVDLTFGVSGGSPSYRERHRKMVKQARPDDVHKIRLARAAIDRAHQRYRDAVARAWKRGRYLETKEDAAQVIQDAGFNLKPWSAEEHPNDHPLVFPGGKPVRTL